MICKKCKQPILYDEWDDPCDPNNLIHSHKCKIKITEVMEMVYLVNQFEKYLREDLNQRSDSADVIITQSFKEVIQSKIKRVEK